ncbi:uncharacterized protein LOC123565383 [Mercenaria mercenaria]|uniref:uncharacterized protein LOC123565383 n=1 Tax=Mercenaria mercenaria TaxID=6596 RepID=UPI00234F228E|nr:uncharacterized protein LOC123565383 [Mercenaria mercenaria]
MAMCLYRKLLGEVGHFNLPLLYGEPMCGKTLTAQCMANVTGSDSVYSRYYTRLNLILFKKAEVSDVAHAMQLEDGACKASAALPGMLGLTDSVMAVDIRMMTLQRLVEGMAVPLTVMTKILEALNLPWSDELFTYLKTEIIPSHMQRLGHSVNEISANHGTFSRLVSDLVSDLAPEQIPEYVKLNGSCLTLRTVELPCQIQQRAAELPGGRTKNVWMGVMKKAKKCRVFDVDEEAAVTEKILTGKSSPF